MKLSVLTLGRKKCILVNQLIHLDPEDFFGLGFANGLLFTTGLIILAG
jgi:hypothetical protein